MECQIQGLKCFWIAFLAVWFGVGNVWIFGGHSSSTDTPNLYSPEIQRRRISERGATQESISSLPTYKFNARKIKSISNKESSSGTGEDGIVAAGTENERLISGEDAVCCICLAKYVHNDELRELPCSHFFHKDCVDKWLKIEASCPLCETDAGETSLSFLTRGTASLRDQTI